MAKVDKTTTVVQKPVTEDRYVLTLTEEEALVLHALLGTCTSADGALDTFGFYNELDNALGEPGLKFDVYSFRNNQRLNSIRLVKITHER